MRWAKGLLCALEPVPACMAHVVSSSQHVVQGCLALIPHAACTLIEALRGLGCSICDGGTDLSSVC